MKKYMMVTTETLSNLGTCFANTDEVVEFTSQMREVVNELSFCMQTRDRLEGEASAIMLLKQICIFTLFCREHMDLIHQLVAGVVCKEITEDEMKELKKDE